MINEPHFENDTITQNSILAICRINEKEKYKTLYNNFNGANISRVSLVKYLYLENDLFNIQFIDSSTISLTRNGDIKIDEIKPLEVLDCMYDLNYFDNKFFDVSGHPIPYLDIYEKNKINIVFFTSKHCKPCEKMKNEMIALSHKKNLNIIFITALAFPFGSDYESVQRKYYFKDMFDKIKFHGYPLMYFFDDKGSLMYFSLKERNNLSDIELIKKYAD